MNLSVNNRIIKPEFPFANYVSQIFSRIPKLESQCYDFLALSLPTIPVEAQIEKSPRQDSNYPQKYTREMFGQFDKSQIKGEKRKVQQSNQTNINQTIRSVLQENFVDGKLSSASRPTFQQPSNFEKSPKKVGIAQNFVIGSDSQTNRSLLKGIKSPFLKAEGGADTNLNANTRQQSLFLPNKSQVQQSQSPFNANQSNQKLDLYSLINSHKKIEPPAQNSPKRIDLPAQNSPKRTSHSPALMNTLSTHEMARKISERYFNKSYTPI